jgi:hypothetical protein
MLHKLVDAIRQGLAAHREYERFMSMGMCHDYQRCRLGDRLRQPDTLAFDCADNPVDEPQAPRSW